MKILSNSFLSVLVILSLSCQKIYLDPRAYVANEKAKVTLKNQNFSDAQDFLLRSLRFAPFQSEVHLNLGYLQEISKDPEKAMKSYKNAQVYALAYSPTPVPLYYGLYNEAQLLGQQKKVDEALIAYQKALTIYPPSKEIKHNIELLIQMQQQQQSGQGQGDNKDQKPNDKKDQKQSKDQKKDQQKDQKEDKGKDPDQKKEYADSPKYKPRPFKGEDLSEGDVKKILGELKQQEQKIRSQFNRKQTKEQPRDKDW